MKTLPMQELVAELMAMRHLDVVTDEWEDEGEGDFYDIDTRITADGAENERIPALH